jgi:hypothetical protein
MTVAKQNSVKLSVLAYFASNRIRMLFAASLFPGIQVLDIWIVPPVVCDLKDCIFALLDYFCLCSQQMESLSLSK